MNRQQEIATNLAKLELYIIINLEFKEFKEFMNVEKHSISLHCVRCGDERVFTSYFQKSNLNKEWLSIYYNFPKPYLKVEVIDIYKRILNQMNWSRTDDAISTVLNDSVNRSHKFNIEEESIIFNWLICNYCYDYNLKVLNLQREDKNDIEKGFNIFKFGSMIHPSKLSHDKRISKKLLDNKLYVSALKSNGFGLYSGAFLYLRKVLEIEISNILNDLKISFDNKDAFSRKLEFLVDADFIENKELYKPLYTYLSKGVHLLSEEECKIAFILVKDVLEFAYEEIQNRRSRRDKLALMQSRLNEIN